MALRIFFSRKQKFLGAKLCVKNGKNWWSTLYMKEVLVAKLQMELQYGIDAFHSGLEFSYKKSAKYFEKIIQK